jgi:cell division septation protein DedD
MAEERTSKPAAESEALKKRLLVRAGFAGLLILILLGVLALFESFTKPAPPPPQARQAPSPISPPPAVQPVPEPPAPPQEIASEKAAEVPPAKPPAPAAEAKKAEEPRAEPEATATPSVVPRASEARREAQVARPGVPQATALAKRAEELPAAPVILPAPRPPPSVGAGYVVQLGVFTNLANAEELRARLMLQGIPSQIEARVLAGPFMTRQEALSAQARLKATGLDAGMLISFKAR